jgi:hypothetical protein
MQARAELDGIVRGIMDAMCSGAWQTGKSHRELADKHKVELATVRAWAADASRMLRLCRGDEQEIRDEILAGVENCHRFALEEKDVRSALAALELRTKVLGLLVTKVQDVTPPKEQLLDQIRLVLRSPTPELAVVLAEEGWVRA